MTGMSLYDVAGFLFSPINHGGAAACSMLEPMKISPSLSRERGS